MQPFFETIENNSILAKFERNIAQLECSTDFDKNRNAVILLIIKSMKANPKEWDSQCQINIKWIGSYFIRKLDSNDDLTKERIDDICSMCFRFLLEMYLSIKNDFSLDFEAARDFVIKNSDFFEPSAKSQINYALVNMPISIFKSIANSTAIDSLKEFNSLSSKAEKIKHEWENDLLERESRVNALRDSLSQYENAFNFVGLYQGFDELSKEKTSERDNILYWLKIISSLLTIPIIIELIVIYSHIENISSIKDGLIVLAIPTLSFAGILIYYFRVLLSSYKAVKSQILQIELRKTLCRFIQNYIEYSQKIKKQDPESLLKFESIIFSGIVTEEGNLPSTYDGVEQIGKLIKSIKS
jgi:hypothetical protein